MLELKNIKFERDNKKILDNVSLKLEDEKFVVITGPNGSGKSTLLNLLGGLDKPDSGEIWIEDKEISTFTSKERTNYLNSYLGFVFQEYNLLPEFNIEKNINIANELQGKKPDKKFKKLMNYADKIKVPKIVIIGKNDLEEGKVTIKDMESGEQELIAIENIVTYLKGE